MTPTMTILYVDQPIASAEFYARLFGIQPAEVSETFALFPLPGGLVLGLWSRHTVEPSAEASGGGCELAIRAESNQAVDAQFETWKEAGIEIIQPPVMMDFGYTFTVLDLDRHRIRMFHPHG